MKELTLLFKALADESRLRILHILARSGELCVCDIEDIMGFTQTKVSRHLAYLRTAGLVEARQQGLWMIYSLAAPKSREQRIILECLRSIVSDNPQAERDARALNRNIKSGCCATVSIVKQQSLSH